jgi:5'-3' exonuclease
MLQMNQNQEPALNTQPKIFIFVDGSYYCFYRYYSLLNWWKNAFPEEPLENPIENTVFVEKFKKTFVESLQQIPKKLNLIKPKPRGKHKAAAKTPNEEPNITMIIGKDCKRENIWRNNFYDKYKATRPNGNSNGKTEDGFMGGPFFKMSYEENLFQQSGAETILYHPRLEADDCIAIYVKKLVEKYPENECSIYIITSDNDYLQLIRENVHIYNLAFKNLKDSKVFTGNPQKDLKIKTIMGDISDNIPSVFPKCGIKTAIKCVEDPEFFKKKMNDNVAYYEQYLLNDTLVSFDKIPEELVNEFTNQLNTNHL